MALRKTHLGHVVRTSLPCIILSSQLLSVLNVCIAIPLDFCVDPMMRLGNPLSGVPWFDAIVVQLVNLFEGQSFGFRNEEIGEKKTPRAGRAPDEKHFDPESNITRTGIDEIRSRIGNSPVPQPIGCSGHRHPFGTDPLYY